MLTLMRLGWGQENPAFRQMFTSQFIPGATKEQADWFNELQRVSTSPENAVRNLEANGQTGCERSAGEGEGADAGDARPRRRPRCRSKTAGAWPPAFPARASCRCRAATT